MFAAAWFYNQSADEGKISPVTTEKVGNANVLDLIKRATVVSHAEVSTSHPTQIATLELSIPGISHADIYFEVGRKGLTGERKAQLSTQTDMLKQHEDYGALIQRSTNHRGQQPTIRL